MLKMLFACVTLLLTTAVGAADEGLPNPQVVIKTNNGDISLRLFRDKAPVTVENFSSACARPRSSDRL